MTDESYVIANRFRGFLPVVVDVETGGFNPNTDALLEISIIIIEMDDQGYVHQGQSLSYHIKPFKGANIQKSAIDFIAIDPYHPLRVAMEESFALSNIFDVIGKEVKKRYCQKAILVGHNASFDLSFVMAAVARHKIKKNPFHSFSCFDTATLAGLVYGQTVLAKACQHSDIEFDGKKAHSARYDTEKTAHLFCNMVNKWKELSGM